jgi:hypothetical protein
VKAVPPVPPEAPSTDVDGFGETGYVEVWAIAAVAVATREIAANARTPVTRLIIST